MEKNDHFEIDRLFYEKANLHRIHLDNLRWTLFGVYSLFFSAAISVISFSIKAVDYTRGLLLLSLALVSTCILFILANLTRRHRSYGIYLAECEKKLATGKPVPTMEEFSEKLERNLPVKNPSFFFMVVIGSIISSLCLVFAAKSLFFDNWFFYPLPVKIAIVIIVTGVYFAFFYLVLTKWPRWIKSILFQR